MRVTVTSEVRFARLPDGSVWAEGAPYSFWSRYLDEFESVTILGREEAQPRPRPGMVRADGPGVELRGVPHYIGPRAFVMRYLAVRHVARPVVYDRGALILRLGSVLALSFEPLLLRSGRPFGVEVVGDPWETFARGAVQTPVRVVARWVLTRSQQRLCRTAAVAAYVTREFLQRRYPCASSEYAVSDVELECEAPFTTHYSSVELANSDFAPHPHVLDSSRPARIITVGSLAQAYKGVDVLIHALSAVRRSGHPCELTVVGDGRLRSKLEALAASVGVPVRFTRHLTRAKVVQELDASDIFVLASRTEGLPRALIEAMARGLPCVATRVGGIPELLDSDALCEAGSAAGLADRICALLTGKVNASVLAIRNLGQAQAFRSDLLRPRRREFYRRVRMVSESWIGRN